METQNKSRNTTIISLPSNIIEQEILPRLPVKSLLRFRCVSTSWRSLIGSEGFIKTQFQSSTKNTSLTHHRVILYTEGFELKQCSLHTLLNEPSSDLSSPSDDQTINQSCVVDCCNGLLCIHNQNKYRFVLWNPATRISFELPKIESIIQTYGWGFGYDVASGAYKVFAIVIDNHRLTGMVYSSKTNSWRRTVGGCLLRYNRGGMFVCGRIHWLNPHSIYSFDLKREVLGVIEHPINIELGYQQWLGEIEGCLCLVSDYNNRRELGVWIMKEYGVQESWLKVLNVPFGFPYSYYSCSAQFEIVSEGVVFLICGSAFMALNRDDTVLSAPNKFTGCFETWGDMFSNSHDTTYFYVESLVSPVPDVNLSTV